jgi:3-hydroxy-9,10-secoandrosta-1,3,5(10)-triene-9,17-dione monooxygenase reductase component
MSDAVIDPGEYRRTLGLFPTGVVVAAASHGGELSGMTIGSFTSVSIDPPLIGFLPMKDSETLELLKKSGAFCINVLSTEQNHICMQFATPGEDRFRGVSHSPTGTGSPMIDSCLAWMDCTVHEIVDAGDHMFVMGRVQKLTTNNSDGNPLVFYGGDFGTFTALD